MDIILIGASHRTASADVRAALALDGDGVYRLLGRIRDGGLLQEAAVVSTCNRTEVYAVTADAAVGRPHLRDVVSAETGVSLGPGCPGFALDGADAALHLHRVAAGLDSMMLGEVQIMGQLRDAHVAARVAGTLGPVLDRLFGSALHGGKRARAESGIGTGAVSVASASVALAERVLGSLEGRQVLVLGAGETGRLVARHFTERRVGRLLVANRTLERAIAVAAECGGEGIGLDALPDALLASDVVIAATGAPGPVITSVMIRRAAKARPDNSLVYVDIAVPPDIEAGGAEPDNVYLYPLDALQAMVDQNLARRQREVPHAEAIVCHECDRFVTWAKSRHAVPVVRELREHFERVRAEEVSRNIRHFSEADLPHVERLTRSLINRLLHVPTARLKGLDGESGLEVVRNVFALDVHESRGTKESNHGR